jgi:hypothetical protein
MTGTDTLMCATQIGTEQTHSRTARRDGTGRDPGAGTGPGGVPTADVVSQVVDRVSQPNE